MLLYSVRFKVQDFSPIDIHDTSFIFIACITHDVSRSTRARGRI